MTRLVVPNYTKHKHREPLYLTASTYMRRWASFLSHVRWKIRMVGKKGPDMSGPSREIRHICAHGCTNTLMQRQWCVHRDGVDIFTGKAQNQSLIGYHH